MIACRLWCEAELLLLLLLLIWKGSGLLLELRRRLCHGLLVLLNRLKEVHEIWRWSFSRLSLTRRLTRAVEQCFGFPGPALLGQQLDRTEPANAERALAGLQPVHFRQVAQQQAVAPKLAPDAVCGSGDPRVVRVVEAKPGALLSLQDSKDPYPIDLHVENGATKVTLAGTVDDPLHFAGATDSSATNRLERSPSRDSGISNWAHSGLTITISPSARIWASPMGAM